MTENDYESAEINRLREALRQVAQAHAWLAFGESRSYGVDVPLLSPAEADALARFALGPNRYGPPETKNEIEEQQREIARLRSELESAMPAMREYGRQHKASNPHRIHEWLQRNDK